MSDLPVAPPTQETMTELQRLRQQVEQDEDGVTFVMGGEKIKVPPLTFHALKKCWDDIGRAANANSVVERVDSLIAILSAALEDSPTPMTPEEISKKLRGREWGGMLIASYGALLVQSGLIDEGVLDTPPTQEVQPPNPGGGGTGRGEGPEGEAGSTPSSNGQSDPSQSLTPRAETSSEPLELEPRATVPSPTSIQ